MSQGKLAGVPAWNSVIVCASAPDRAASIAAEKKTLKTARRNLIVS
jgi:hypothetical protein